MEGIGTTLGGNVLGLLFLANLRHSYKPKCRRSVPSPFAAIIEANQQTTFGMRGVINLSSDRAGP